MKSCRILIARRGKKKQIAVNISEYIIGGNEVYAVSNILKSMLRFFFTVNNSVGEVKHGEDVPGMI